MIDGYASFVSYFRKLAWQHHKLRGSFFVGDSWTLVGAQRSNVIYPAFWLERPVIRPVYAPDGDSLRLKIDCGFSVVANVATDDYDKQEAMLQLCQTIAKEVINRVKADADTDTFDLFVDTIRLDPLAVLMADDVHGWRVEFGMQTLNWSDCVDENAWVLLDENDEENLPIEPDYSPYFEPDAPAFSCVGTVADFAVHYDPARGLRLTDCSTYQDTDRRRDVIYTITDGTETVTVNEFDRLLTDAQVATLDGNVAWTITITIQTMRGCVASKTYTFDIRIWGGGGGTPPPVTGISIIDSENSRLLDSGNDATIE